MDASIVITTKNRKADLRRALQSSLRQRPEAEVVVVDDGSDDGTWGMVRQEFPSVLLHRNDRSRGATAGRNQGAVIASGDVIFSPDDDAEFTTQLIVSQTLAEFDHPRVGAVAIPWVNVRDGVHSPERGRPPDSGCIYACRQFTGLAYAVRRDVFLALGGYREVLGYAGEETEFCARMLDHGFVVRMGNSDPIHHREAPHRNLGRQAFAAARNSMVTAWCDAPLAWLMPCLLGSVANHMRAGMSNGFLRARTHGLFVGLMTCLRLGEERRPISTRAFLVSRALNRGPMRLTDVSRRMGWA